jgi:ketosteroid isomerase-like protein
VSENLELVRSIFAAWERGDFSRDQWADPAMDFIVTDGPEPGSRRGPAATAWIQGFFDAWDSVRFEAVDFREIDDGRVLVVYHMKGRGKASGVGVDQRRASSFQIEDGRVIRMVTWWDPDRAVADLGLEE